MLKKKTFTHHQILFGWSNWGN